jgi:hypothetical protein
MWEMDYDQAAAVWINKDKESVHMEKADLKTKIDDFIKAHNTCALATASGDFVRCTPDDKGARQRKETGEKRLHAL